MFSLPDGTEMFHFPSFPPHALYIQAWVTALTYGRVSPFGHPRITARLTAPRGLSRSTTSFIGSWCQGIHRAPLKTWPQRCSHPLFRSQTPTGSPPPRTSGHEVPTRKAEARHEKRQPAPHPLSQEEGPRLRPQDPTACDDPRSKGALQAPARRTGAIVMFHP